LHSPVQKIWNLGATKMDRAELTDTILFPFCAYLIEKTGISFEKNRQDNLKNAIATRLDALGLTDPKEYFSILNAGFGENQEFNTLIDLLTIRESFFFRHRAQYDVLQKHCLPQLLDIKGSTGQVNIWSAGCANGEEAYSIAMIIRDMIPAETNGRRVFIRATDISADALIQARKGEYSERAIRELEPSQVERFFLKRGSRYFLKNEIKSMVQFEHFNLAQKLFPLETMPLWDLIFCRNVIIYFDEDITKRLLHNFYLSLADGGYFFPGYSETLRYLNNDFVSLEREGAFIYQKQPNKKETGVNAALRTEAGKEKTVTLPRKRPLTLVRKTKSAAEQRKTDLHSIIPNKKASAEKETGAGVTGQSNVDTILADAQKNADQGKTMEAAALIEALIARDPLCEKAYFILAMIYRNTGVTQQAIGYLKKVAYLNPRDPVVRLHLADLYREASENRNAAREYANVITLLENTEEKQTTFFSEEFSKEVLLKTARVHLQSIHNHHTDTVLDFGLRNSESTKEKNQG